MSKSAPSPRAAPTFSNQYRVYFTHEWSSALKPFDEGEIAIFVKQLPNQTREYLASGGILSIVCADGSYEYSFNPKTKEVFIIPPDITEDAELIDFSSFNFPWETDLNTFLTEHWASIQTLWATIVLKFRDRTLSFTVWLISTNQVEELKRRGPERVTNALT